MSKKNSLQARFQFIESKVQDNIIELAAKEFETHFLNFQNTSLALSTITYDFSLTETQLDAVKALLGEKGYDVL